MQYPVKVLYIYGDTLRYGGIEMFMMNMFRNIDRKQVQIDFLLQSVEKSPLEEEIKRAGSKIYYVPKPSKDFIGYNRALRQVLSSGEYRIVHAHCDAMNYRIMKIAEACGVPVRIAHSHNTKHLQTSRLRLAYYEYCRKKVGKFATVRWACSDAAGRWLFGKYAYTVIPNAINLKNFQFDAEKRTALRQTMGVADNTVVLGHVGRFDYQKNQLFLLRVLKKLRADGTDYRVLFVGDGWMRQMVEQKAAQEGLTDAVMFVGEVSTPQDYYHMMDIYVMPSVFEGFCIAVEEAEANGLNCIVSDRIPGDVDVPGQIVHIPLEERRWCEAIQSASTNRSSDGIRVLADHGMEITSAAQKLQGEYIRLYQNAAGVR